MAVGIQYGNENPRAIEPFQIESTLAPLAVAGNANAQTLLQQYHTQNQVEQDQYLANLQGQHDLAREQLVAQLQEAAMKETPNWFKTPGLARLAQSQGMLPGVSAADVAPSVGEAEQAQAATNLKEAGTGFNQFSQGGYQFANPNAVPGSPGGIATNLGPAMVQSEKIKAATSSANAANAGNSITTSSAPIRDPVTGIDMTYHFGKNVGDAARQKFLLSHGATSVDAPPPNQPLPGGGTSAAPSGTFPGNNLPYAQTDGGATSGGTGTNLPPSPSSGAASNTTAGANAVRNTLTAALPQIASNPKIPNGAAIAQDIRDGAKANGGAVNVQPDGSGGWVAIGARGRYRL